jgi:hypothetical protein
MKESFDWILAAINGCKTKFHVQGCHTLIGLFRIKYVSNDGKLEYSKYYGELIEAFRAKKELVPDHD